MKKNFRAPLISLLLAASSVLCASAQHSHGKMSRDVTQASEGAQTVRVIIQYNVPPTAAHAGRIANAGGTVHKVFSVVPGIVATVPAGSVSSLADDPDVKYVSVDRAVGSKTAWYDVEPVNAPTVWSSGLDGTGIGIAVIDSGIDSNMLDLDSPSGGGSSSSWFAPWSAPNSRVVFEHNFLTGGYGNSRFNTNTNDQYGHGTHVAGIIAGNGSQSTGRTFTRTFKGLAPNANLIDLQVLDQNGQGTDSNVIAAIEMAITLKKTYNIRVINLSLGRPVYESYTLDPLCQAVEQAWKAGIVVVVAAGNDGRLTTFNSEGYGTINAPGNDPYVLTAGATDTNNTATIVDDTVASYSSKGPSLGDDIAKPDLMAPGSLIASLRVPYSTLVLENPTLVTLLSDYTIYNIPIPSFNYFPLSGTSMAAAVTSGASALLLEADPNLTPDQVKALLMRDAQKGIFPASSTVTDGTGSYTSYNDLLTVGAGYLNIQASVTDALQNSASLPTGYALSPTVQLDPTTDTMSLVFNQTSLWTYNTTWEPAAIYGSQQFQDVSGSTFIWGRNTVAGSTFIWGRSSVAASTFIWGRSGLEAASELGLTSQSSKDSAGRTITPPLY
jgi:serine protease AprX